MNWVRCAAPPARLSLSLAALLLLSCCHPTPPPWQPPVWEPAPLFFRPPPPDPCRISFDPCACGIEKYSITSLEDQLSESGWTDYRRQEVASNVSNTADYYKHEFWSYRIHTDAVRALRYYAAYLGLVPLSDSSAPYALLHSIALYCSLGCRQKASGLATELRSNYRYAQADLDAALRECE
ncbi:MAG TPA: hypothetical protein VHR45_14070 [Thermoanaerobaculia bacterium]|nr:hypothetical protein [Thermoanaerobaculia bacterium]